MRQQQVYYVSAPTWVGLCQGIDEYLRQAREAGESQIISLSHAVAVTSGFTAIVVLETDGAVRTE
jgi:hypothetical protein